MVVDNTVNLKVGASYGKSDVSYNCAILTLRKPSWGGALVMASEDS